MLIKILGGFLMALADSVPGVSGGTVAFLIGIYDDFITSLNNVVSKDKEKRLKSWKFLAMMGSGWIVGMGLAALIITSVFETHIYKVSSLFIGFIIFAIPLIILEEKEAFKKNYLNAFFILIGAALVAFVTFFSSTDVFNSVNDIAISKLSLVAILYIFIAAMFAISAMVLPGISGSTILLVFGLYQPVMGAIHNLLHMELEYLPGLIIFGLGVVTGIFTVVKVLKACLDKHRGAIMYFILGMMLASIYAIIMGPTSLKDNPQPMMTFATFDWIFFAIGAAVIFGLQMLKKIKK